MSVYTLSIGAGSSSMSTVPWVSGVASAPAIHGDIEGAGSNSRRLDSDRLRTVAESTGLTAVLFDREAGLIPAIPCISPITPIHTLAVQTALSDWRAAHPTATPRFNGDFAGDYVGVAGATLDDSILAILVWMDFWMTWAGQNCKVPALMVR